MFRLVELAKEHGGIKNNVIFRIGDWGRSKKPWISESISVRKFF